MGKYTHLNEDELISYVEKFGTEDEQEILLKIRPVLDYEDCPHCENRDGEIDSLQSKIDSLQSKITEAIEALS